MIDKKNTFSFIQLILSSFYLWQILSTAPLKIVPYKVCKITTNHMHLLSIGDDREFV